MQAEQNLGEIVQIRQENQREPRNRHSYDQILRVETRSEEVRQVHADQMPGSVVRKLDAEAVCHKESTNKRRVQGTEVRWDKEKK